MQEPLFGTEETAEGERPNVDRQDRVGRRVGAVAWLAALAATSLVLTTVAMANNEEEEEESSTTKYIGDVVTLGNGQVRTYARIRADGSPAALGIEFPASALTGLPSEMSDGASCWDVDGDGELSDHECAGGHAKILYFPKEQNTPFKWMQLNWSRHGHGPEGIYDVDHFDVHFFIQDYRERNFIRPGPCGIVVNCDDYERGVVPVPEGYMPAAYSDLGAVASREGNHLLDLSSPEYNGGQFTHTFIYGAYDGKITFWEPLITLEYLESKPDECVDIKVPQKYEVAGYYPTRYCMRYKPNRDVYRIKLAGFVYRDAS